MSKKLTVIILAIALFSCTKKVDSPLTETVGTIASDLGIERSRVDIHDLYYYSVEPCTGQGVNMTGDETITYTYNPNKGVFTTEVELRITGTLQDGETFKISVKSTVKTPDGGVAFLSEKTHYRTNHHVGSVVWTLQGYHPYDREFTPTYEKLEIHCGQ